MIGTKPLVLLSYAATVLFYVFGIMNSVQSGLADGMVWLVIATVFLFLSFYFHYQYKKTEKEARKQLNAAEEVREEDSQKDSEDVLEESGPRP